MASPLDEILIDPVAFVRRLTIKGKNGKLVRFGDVITSEQIELIRALQQHKRIIVVKARQMGISTVVRAFCFWQALTSRDSINTAVVSNKERSALNLLDIDRRFYNKLPKSLQRTLSVDAQSRIQFASNGTNLLAMTAKADSQDRGYTLNMAHLSEFAFYSNADVYLSSLIASINDGGIIIESTPNYYDDALHKLIQANNYNQSWHVVFMPWSSFSEYRSDKLVEPNEYEQLLMKEHGLDIEQISWRRHKIAEMQSESLFRKEYPLTIEEAWSVDDRCYFTVEQLEQFATPYTSTPYGEQTFVPPVHGMFYAIGVDPAGGTGGDFSVATVVNKIDNSIVAKLSANKLGIRDFTLRTLELAKKYNNALIMFEQNNHGHGFEQVLIENKYNNWKSWLTTQSSKILLYENLRTHINEGTIANIDSLTLSELRMLQSSPNGNAPKHPDGMHDDQVVSFALGLEALKSVKMPIDPYSRQFNTMTNKPKQTTLNPLQSLRGR